MPDSTEYTPEQIENVNQWFHVATHSDEFVGRANALASTVAEILATQGLDPAKAPGAELWEQVPEQLRAQLRVRLQDEMYLLTGAIVASGFLISDCEGGKLPLEVAEERTLMFGENLVSLVQLNHRVGQIHAMEQQVQ